MAKYDELAAKYKKRIEKELGSKVEEKLSTAIISREYQTFKDEMLPVKMTFYEKGCNIAERIFKISPDKKRF